MGGIGVVLNPRSRQNLRDPRAALRLARTLGDHGVVRTAASRDDLARIAEDFRRLQIDVLGISGGDGTNYVTITGFLAGVRGRAAARRSRSCAAARSTPSRTRSASRAGAPTGCSRASSRRYADRASTPLQCVERHVMRIGDHYGFIFGTGAIYGFIAEYNQAEERERDLGRGGPRPRGRQGRHRAADAGRAALGGPGHRSTTREVFPERDYLAIGAGHGRPNRPRLPPLLPLRRASPAPSTILGIHTSALGFVRKLPDVWRARPMGPEHTYDRRRAPRGDRGAERRRRVLCDGDVHEHAGPLTLETGPRVRILVEHKPGLRPARAAAASLGLVDRLAPARWAVYRPAMSAHRLGATCSWRSPRSAGPTASSTRRGRRHRAHRPRGGARARRDRRDRGRRRRAPIDLAVIDRRSADQGRPALRLRRGVVDDPPRRRGRRPGARRARAARRAAQGPAAPARARRRDRAARSPS